MSASIASAELPLPRNIGSYTLFDRIGRGGMADIYLARARTDLGATRLVVVKQVLPHLAASPEFSELLITEAKLAARLDHANVVQVHDLGRTDGFLYIAMQYVEGFDLAELLRRCARLKVPLPIQYGLLIVMEVLRGLDYAHRRDGDDGRPLGIVHRDVSPSNILISFEGEVKLCDFGIAHANDVVDVAPDDAIRGKAGYMSPEHAKGLPVDGRADVFALGIVLWELLAGKRLYRVVEGGPSLIEMARAASVPDLPIRGLPHEAELHAISRKALASDPSQRFLSARAMLDALEGYAAKSKLLASPLRFGEWLIDRFGDDIIQQRRARERAVKALEAGPVAVVEPLLPEYEIEVSLDSDRCPSQGPMTHASPDEASSVVATARAAPGHDRAREATPAAEAMETVASREAMAAGAEPIACNGSVEGSTLASAVEAVGGVTESPSGDSPGRFASAEGRETSLATSTRTTSMAKGRTGAAQDLSSGTHVARDPSAGLAALVARQSGTDPAALAASRLRVFVVGAVLAVFFVGAVAYYLLQSH